jgi:hypothetical protein
MSPSQTVPLLFCYPWPRESMFTKPLPSKWTSASGFQSMFTNRCLAMDYSITILKEALHLITQCIYVFHVIHRINSDYFPLVEALYVSCDVGTKFLNIICTNFRLQMST